MSHVNPPKQRRSRRTLERIVAASLDILDTQGPDGLTVHEVVKRANSSVGSFYARFGGKDDLLDYLGERVWHEASQRWRAAVESREWEALELPDLVGGAVSLLHETQRSRSTYLRALDRTPGGPSDAYASFRRELVDGLSRVILVWAPSFSHPDPQKAVRLGLAAVMGILEHYGADGGDEMTSDEILQECRLLLLAYLTGDSQTGDSSEGVEFFDVWG